MRTISMEKAVLGARPPPICAITLSRKQVAQEITQETLIGVPRFWGLGNTAE